MSATPSPPQATTRYCRRCNDWLPLSSFGWRDAGRTKPQSMCRYCRRKYDQARRTKGVMRWAGMVRSAKDSAVASAAVAGLKAFNGTMGLAKAIAEAVDALPPGSFGRARLLAALLRLHSALPPDRLDLLSDEDLAEQLRRSRSRLFDD